MEQYKHLGEFAPLSVKKGDTVLIKDINWFERHYNPTAQCIQNFFLKTEYLVTLAHKRLLSLPFEVVDVNDKEFTVTIEELDGSNWEIPSWLIDSVL